MSMITTMSRSGGKKRREAWRGRERDRELDMWLRRRKEVKVVDNLVRCKPTEW